MLAIGPLLIERLAVLNSKNVQVSFTPRGFAVIHLCDEYGITVSNAWNNSDGTVDVRVETWGALPYQEVLVDCVIESNPGDAVRVIVSDIVAEVRASGRLALVA